MTRFHPDAQAQIRNVPLNPSAPKPAKPNIPTACSNTPQNPPGRSDFPNQVNNSLGFPGIFRGTLDVRARTITDEMCFAAADALAGFVGDKLTADQILPTMDDWKVFAEEAAAVGLKAQEQGVARLTKTREELFESAHAAIARSRNMTRLMMDHGIIPPPPAE